MKQSAGEKFSNALADMNFAFKRAGEAMKKGFASTAQQLKLKTQTKKDKGYASGNSEDSDATERTMTFEAPASTITPSQNGMELHYHLTSSFVSFSCRSLLFDSIQILLHCTYIIS